MYGINVRIYVMLKTMHEPRIKANGSLDRHHIIAILYICQRHIYHNKL